MNLRLELSVPLDSRRTYVHILRTMIDPDRTRTALPESFYGSEDEARAFLQARMAYLGKV